MYDIFERLMKEHGVSASDVSKATGIARSNFTDWKMGRATPKIGKLQKIANYFGEPLEVFTGQYTQAIASSTAKGFESFTTEASKVASNIPKLPHRHLIPVLGCVAAGYPIEAEQNILDWEEISDKLASSGEHFALKIKGDSMEPKFSTGDVVIVRKQDFAEDGDYVIVLIDGHEATCKRLKKYDDGIALVSMNPTYQPKYFSKEEILSVPVQILGVVKELRAKF